MKCKLIKRMRAWNPDFDREAQAKAKEAGQPYDVPNIIWREQGHIQDHPDSWKHCVRGFMNAEPNAVPFDDECKERVKQWQAERPGQIKKLANLLRAKGPQPKDSPYSQLREAYAEELNQLDAEHFPLGEHDDAEFFEEEEDD